MGRKPLNRREALLEELCVGAGFCSNRLGPDDLGSAMSAKQIAELVLRREGLDPTMIDRKLYALVLAMVRDWLFDRGGRGERSGLPR